MLNVCPGSGMVEGLKWPAGAVPGYPGGVECPECHRAVLVALQGRELDEEGWGTGRIRLHKPEIGKDKK